MISFDDLQNLYPLQSIKVDGGLNLNNVDYGFKPRLDQESLQQQATQPHQWHHSVLRLSASLVAEGKTDDEVHAIKSRLTCAPHTVEETRAQVQTMIDGARAKRFGSKFKNTQDHQPSSSIEPIPLLRKFQAPKP